MRNRGIRLRNIEVEEITKSAETENVIQLSIADVQRAMRVGDLSRAYDLLRQETSKNPTIDTLRARLPRLICLRLETVDEASEFETVFELAMRWGRNEDNVQRFDNSLSIAVERNTESNKISPSVLLQALFARSDLALPSDSLLVDIVDILEVLFLDWKNNDNADPNVVFNIAKLMELINNSSRIEIGYENLDRFLSICEDIVEQFGKN